MFGRRRFVGGALAATAVGLGRPWTARGQVAADSSLAAARRGGILGPLQAADARGIEMPAGFTSRIIAQSGALVPGTSTVFHDKPDGAGVVPTSAGWYLVSNSEVDGAAGGATAIRFDAAGGVVGAARVLSASHCCAGSVTPWGTWLACQEVADGQVYEVDPTGARAPTVRPGCGRFTHEAAAVDASGQAVYLTEDVVDGCLYRFRYQYPDDLSTGTLEVASVAGDLVTWLTVPDPDAATMPTRYQVASATHFNGGEGMCRRGREIVFTTKGDDRVWSYDLELSRIRVIYDRSTASIPILSGVDNVIDTPMGDLLVCEDGGNMELVLLDRRGFIAPLLRVAGQPSSELTGVCISPDGRHLYVTSQRGVSPTRGIVYGITGPFPW